MAIETDLSASPALPDMLDALLRKSNTHVLVDKWQSVHPSRTINTELGLELKAFTKVYGDGKWHIFEQNREQESHARDILERDTRIQELANPASQENLQANLYWVSERGIEEDLELLQRLRDAPPPDTSETVLQLIDLAIQRILACMGHQDDSLAAAQRQGIAAYRAHKAEWDQRYAGRYIAVYRGEVVATDAKKQRLLEKIFKKQREQGPFRSCIVKTARPQSDS